MAYSGLPDPNGWVGRGLTDHFVDGEIWSGVVEAKTMTVTNLLEVVVVLAILCLAYRFF
jgi:hypothetical protein